jgi:hypothetical protein
MINASGREKLGEGRFFLGLMAASLDSNVSASGKLLRIRHSERITHYR